MKLIDIDKIEELKSHVHYIKEYKASAILMDTKAVISRYNIQFTIEYRPVGSPFVNVQFIEHPQFPVDNLVDNVKVRINELEKNGALHAEHRRRRS